MSQKGVFREDNTSIWVEKYRPKTLDEYIGNRELKDKFRECIKNQDLPHFLFEGPAGTGKCLDFSEEIIIEIGLNEEEYNILKKFEVK